MNPENPRAFPLTTTNPGMSLRDYFAGQALVGSVTDKNNPLFQSAYFASAAYALADAMLKVRAE